MLQVARRRMVTQERADPARRARAPRAERDRQHEADLQRWRHDRGEEHEHGDDLLTVLPEMPRATEDASSRRGGRPPTGRASARCWRRRRGSPRRARGRACDRASPPGGGRAPCCNAGTAPPRPRRARAGAAEGRNAGRRSGRTRRPARCSRGRACAGDQPPTGSVRTGAPPFVLTDWSESRMLRSPKVVFEL